MKTPEEIKKEIEQKFVNEKQKDVELIKKITSNFIDTIEWELKYAYENNVDIKNINIELELPWIICGSKDFVDIDLYKVNSVVDKYKIEIFKEIDQTLHQAGYTLIKYSFLSNEKVNLKIVPFVLTEKEKEKIRVYKSGFEDFSIFSLMYFVTMLTVCFYGSMIAIEFNSRSIMIMLLILISSAVIMLGITGVWYFKTQKIYRNYM